MFDLVIRHGTLIDGTGQSRRRADVAIKGDRIAAIGELSDASASREIDATGHIVAPGFLDVHNHSDGWLLRKPHFAAKTTQGFTTEVLAADGIGYAPVNEATVREWFFYLRSLNGLRQDDWTGWKTLDEYLQALDRRSAQNAATHLPYANVRTMACGFGPRRIDDFQMREIQRQIQIGMEAGAVGVSTGLDYIAECFSTTDELSEALSVMAPFNGLYVTHVRYKKGLLPALREAVEIGRRAKVRVHISHLKGQAPGQVEQVLEYLDKTARHEVDLSFDVYPYQPGSTMLNYLLPYEVWEDGPMAAIGKLNDPLMRAKFAEGLEAYRLPLDKLRIAWVQSRDNACHQGRTVKEYIDASGLPAVDALLNLLIEERLAVLLVFDEGDDRLVEPLLKHDLFMLGSDGIYFEDGQVHPRVYGSVGRLLGPLVRDRGLMTLEQAIHRMSGYPARRFQLTDRGTLTEGAFADVAIFDPDIIADRATYAAPHQPCAGMSSVIVNGTPIITNGQPVSIEQPPGRALRASQ